MCDFQIYSKATARLYCASIKINMQDHKTEKISGKTCTSSQLAFDRNISDEGKAVFPAGCAGGVGTHVEEFIAILVLHQMRKAKKRDFMSSFTG